MARQKQHRIEREGSENPYDVMAYFLDNLKNCSKGKDFMLLHKAAEMTGVPYHYVYQLRKEYPEFEQAIINIMGSYYLRAAEDIKRVIMKTQINVDNPNPQVLMKMLEHFERNVAKYFPDISNPDDDMPISITSEEDD